MYLFHVYIHIYIYIYIYIRCREREMYDVVARALSMSVSQAAFCAASADIPYGQFSKIHVCFCGLDPGNLKFETARTNKQRICF